MSFLERVLVILATTGVPGNAGAGAAGPAQDADSAQAAHHVSGAASFVPTYSFADIVNLPAGAEQRLLSSADFGRTPEGQASELFRINHATAVLPVASALNGAFDELSAHPSGTGVAGLNSRAGVLIPIDEIPEPSGWMLMLCGLAVAGFMARRKRVPPAD